jgi:hypothetical protein
MNNMNQDELFYNFKTAPPVWDIDFEERMNGKEIYPVKGFLIPSTVITIIIDRMRGLLLTANCLEKAVVVSNVLQEYYKCKINIVFGSICITWKGTQYGHLFNPPLEFHAWNTIETKNKQYSESYIIDFSLPGVIIRGKKFKDEQGTFLIGLKPIILNGICPDFIQYKEERKL